MTQPEISPETMQAMWEFFLKTSVPRLIEESEEKTKEKDSGELFKKEVPQ